MTDPAIKVLKSADLAPFSMVDSSSVEFTITLPTQVQGDLNPLVGLGSTADAILNLACE